MVEITIMMVVFAIGFGALTMTLLGSTSLRQTTRETSLAVEAAQSALERVRGETFANAFATYNANPADDPGGAGLAPGNLFAVRGLNVRNDDADGFVGEILFPGNGIELREDSADDALGMPRDLTADSVLDIVDVSDRYTLLPVRVRIEWTGSSGNRFIEVVSSITEFQ
jgi:hypothetical protein